MPTCIRLHAMRPNLDVSVSLLADHSGRFIMAKLTCNDACNCDAVTASSTACGASRGGRKEREAAQLASVSDVYGEILPIAR